MRKNEKFEEVLAKQRTAGDAIEGAVRSVRAAAKELAEEAKRPAEPRKLGPMERLNIAKLAYNAACAFARMRSAARYATWDDAAADNDAYVNAVEEIERALRLGLPEMAPPSVDELNLDVDSSAFYVLVAEAAIKIESGWEPAAAK